MTKYTLNLGKLTQLSKGPRNGLLAAVGLTGEIDAAKQEILKYCNLRAATHTPAFIESFHQATSMALQEMINNDFTLYRCSLVSLPLEGMLSQINLIVKTSPKRWNKQLKNLLIATYGDFSDFLLGYKQNNQTPEGSPRPWKNIGAPTPEQIISVARDLNAMLSPLILEPYRQRLEPDNLTLIQEIRHHLRPHLFKRTPYISPRSLSSSKPQ